MTKALKTLARLQRAQIDEMRRAFAVLAGEQAALTARETELAIEIAREQSVLPPAEFATAYAAYAPSVVSRQAAHKETRMDLSAREAEMQADLVEAHAELRKFELLLEAEERRERDRERARELAMLDEAAMRAAVRSRDAG